VYREIRIMSSLQTNPPPQTTTGDSCARLPPPAAPLPYQTNLVPFPDTWNTRRTVNSNDLAPSLCVLPCTVCYHMVGLNPKRIITHQMGCELPIRIPPTRSRS
jgi:hypothetical protein